MRKKLNKSKYILYIMALSLPFGNIIRIKLMNVGEKTFVFALYEIIIMFSILLFMNEFLNNVIKESLNSIIILWVIISIINCMIMIYVNKYITTSVYLKNMYYILTWSVSMLTYISFSHFYITDTMKRKLIKLFIFSTFILLVVVLYWEYKIYNITSIITLTSFRLGAFEGAKEPYSSINTNNLGVLLSFAFILLYSFKPSYKTIILKVIFFTAVILTSSRESIILLVCGLTIHLIIEKKYRKIQLIEISTFIIVFASIFFLAMQYKGEYNGFIIRFSTFFNPREALEESRLVLWRKIINNLFELKSSFFIGYGPEGVLYMSQLLLNESIYNGDNSIISVFISQGIIGLILFSSFIIMLIYKLLCNLKSNEDIFARSVISITFAYIITSLFSPRFLWPYNPLNASLLFFCSIYLKNKSEREKKIEATDI